MFKLTSDVNKYFKNNYIKHLLKEILASFYNMSNFKK